MRSQSRVPLVLSILLLPSSILVTGAPAATKRAACTQETAISSFDYVIVGGGTAGLVLANRLTENENTTVAVIEAGTFPEDVAGNWSQIPGYASKFNSGHLEMSWGFEVTPQPHLMNRTIEYNRAKALGGCSNVNYMSYGQTSKGAHQRWADEVDDQSYTYENILQYYHKAMNFSEPIEGARSANATGLYNKEDVTSAGTLRVTFGAYVQAWSTWAAKGLEAIGIPQVAALVNGNGLGWAWALVTVTSSESARSNSETAYLRPVLGRQNLVVFDYTFAERIVFDTDKIATGVEVTSTADNCSSTISANKEVILSAGVFQSPHLLQVSGVGPKALLEKYSIDVVADRPGVGQNMHDQLTAFASYQVNVITHTRLDQDPEYLAAAVEYYNTNRTGVLAGTGGDLIGMEKIPEEMRTAFSNDTKTYLADLPEDWPEIAYNVYPAGVTTPAKGANYAILQATLLAPRSRGSVNIQSADMSVAPVIDPNWLSEQTDVEVLTAGVKRVRQALNSTAMAPVLIGDEILPGVDVQTDDDIAAYLAKVGNPIYHAFASNKMGRTSDPDAVVDSRGRVIGVSNLRVIDSSSFPFLPPGPSPQTQVYLLAEKLADDIKKTVY
ncbi:glucose-methanol-choline oxidoreductase [Diaporthe amygdali]|uniref:glucose-methanol-choline oxidoreductase n=1 Tax=Phomopsis amygdali TaxID=1214568 RepID=UPI0022FECF98|nr:glucose-methanol-choline oxidoreductase [Diaporthe amygdali]KAJ0108714.1 glucose-methanol-choline oxidoreductase [Diaporthe amygdali]